MKSHAFGFALFSLTALVASAPAEAQNGTLTRSFVSSTGVDTNPCTITEPCASFAHAYTAIGANGIVAALDPGKYGPLTIIGPVTINGNGWAAITGVAHGAGIIINADPSDNITLIGLEIDGAGAAYNGIVFNSGSNLTITDCVVQNFGYDGGDDANTGNGILLQPTSQFAGTVLNVTVTRTTASNNSNNGILIEPISGNLAFSIADTTAASNGNAGIFYLPPSSSISSAFGSVDHTMVVSNSLSGIAMDTRNTTGRTAVTISNSVTSANEVGINLITGTGALDVAIDNDAISGNLGTGVVAQGATNVILSRTSISGNGLGVNNQTSPNGFYSAKDNHIKFNSPDFSGTALNTFTNN